MQSEARVPEPGSARCSANRRRALVGLAVLVASFFPELLFAGRVLYERDISIVWEPQVQSFVRAVSGGSLPLWDPLVSFGHPMLANPNSQVLYPPAWLNLILAPGVFYTGYALAHLIAAGFGLFLLARRLEQSPRAAFLAATAYVASGPLLSLVNVWHHLAGATLLPWICLAAERALRSGRPPHAVTWGLVLGISVVAGSPDYTLLSGIVVAVWTLERVAVGELSRARLASLAAVALIVALGVSAAQWMPSLAAAADSARRALDPALRMPSSSSVTGLLELASPVPWTEAPIATWLRGPLYGGGEPFLHGIYVGVPVLALAALALAGPRRPRRGLLAALALGFTLFALGPHGPVYGLTLRLVPFLRSIRYPSKALVVVAFALALLAGMGLETWRSCAAGRKLRLLAAGLVLAALAALAAAALAFQPRPLLAGFLLDEGTLGASWTTVLWPFGRRLILAAAVWFALAALAAWMPARSDARLVSAVLVLVALDLWLANRTINTTAPPDIFRYRPPLADLLANESAPRVYVYRYPLRPAPPHPALPVDNPYRIAWFPAGYDVHSGQMLAARLYPMPPVGAAFGLAGSYDPDLLGLYPRHLAELVKAMAAAEGTPAYSRYLRLGAVTHVVALHERGLEDLTPLRELHTPFVLPVRVFRVGATLGRTYVVGGARIAEGEEALRVLVDPGFDPQREIVLPPGASLAGSPAAPPPGRSRILQARADRVLLEAELAAPGYVVLVETYDSGWRATIDGRPAAVLRANVAFRAVAVGPGHHLIELRYRPRWVIVGTWVSGVALTLALVVVGRRRAKAGTGPTS